MKMKCMLATATVIVLSAVNTISAQNTFPSTGNVGVGTTTPANRLTVKGDGIGVSNESTNGAVKVGFYVTGASAFLQTHTNHPLAFATNNGAVQATLLTNGNFGIGTSAPQAKLEVAGKTRINNIDIWQGNGSSTSTSIAIGQNTLGATTTGYGNIGFGKDVLSTNTIGHDNVAIGYQSQSLAISGIDNVSIGNLSLYQNQSGGSNVAIGGRSITNNTTGLQNTAVGGRTLEQNTQGVSNVAIGFVALTNNTTGNSNVAIGFGSNNNVGNLSNATAIGGWSLCTASDQVRIGNTNVTSIGGYVGWTNVSDARVKRNIKANVPGLQFINKLTPVTYNLDLNAADKIIGISNEKNIDAASRQVKEQQIQTGFLAQDVEKAAKALGYDFSGVDAPKNDKDLYGLRYAEFVVPLVKAVQELSKLNEEKDGEIKNLQQQIDEIKELLKANTSTIDTKQNIKISSAALSQNIPNPFNNGTSIAYTLPDKYTQAKMIISDKAGRAIKEFSLTGKGSGTININSSELNAGTYQYSLFVNNTLVETKQMIVIK